jgi:hypothetical protein
VNNKLGELGCLFCNFSDASSSVFADLNINVLKAVENLGENFGLNNYFCEIDGVLGDLCEALANVSLKLSIWVRDQGSKVWYCTLINYSLSKLFSVLGNF